MITYSVKLNAPDKAYLLSSLQTEQSLFNDISQIVYSHNRPTSIKKVHDLCYDKMRKKYPQVSSQIVIKSYQAVLACYKSIASNKQKIAQAVQKRSLSLRLDKNLYSRFTNTSIDLQSSISRKRQTATFVLYDKIKNLFQKYEVADPLLFAKNNELYLAISFKVPELLPSNDDVLGVDRGIKRLYATSDGEILKGTEFQKQKRKIRYLKRQLQKKGTKSARRHLKKLSKKEQNYSDNYAHLVVNKLLETNKDVIAIEDLSKIKKNTARHTDGTKKHKFNRCFSQIPMYKFQEILTYKAPLKGKKVVTVSPYMTSQQDCRGLSNGTRVKTRYYAVDGKQLDADINAAVNIANRISTRPISYPKKSTFIGRLQVNQPDVCKSKAI